MSYGALSPPSYEARLQEVQAQDGKRFAEAQKHVAALLRGARAQESTTPFFERLVDASERTAAALERIAAAQERAFPDPPPQREP